MNPIDFFITMPRVSIALFVITLILIFVYIHEADKKREAKKQRPIGRDLKKTSTKK